MHVSFKEKSNGKDTVLFASLFANLMNFVSFFNILVCMTLNLTKIQTKPASPQKKHGRSVYEAIVRVPEDSGRAGESKMPVV